MARGGHNKKPSNLKVIQGTARADRMPANEPRPTEIAAPKPPAGMDRYAKRAWVRLTPILERLGLLTESDLETFTALCHAWGRYERALRRLKQVEKRADVFDDLDTIRRAEVSVEKAESSFRLLATEFGLSPASRSRLSVETQGDEDESILGQLWRQAN